MRRAILALAALLSACGGPARESETPPPLQFDPPAATTAPKQAALRHGERLASVLGCRGCHGKDLTGHVGEDDPKVALLWTSNLTRVLPAYDDAQLERALRAGVRNDGSPLWGMPSELFSHLSGPDMAALIAWLRTVQPKGEEHPRIRIGPEGRKMIEKGEIKATPVWVRESRRLAPARLDGRYDWARYMVRATCAECHGMELKGGDPKDPKPTPDLIVASAYGRDEFRRLLRTGEPTGGRRLGLMAEVAKGRFVHLTDREVDAIHDYLKARAEAPQ
ncbi:MAG TPA: c-type cytochrome [Allosphingosinicella sp.]